MKNNKHDASHYVNTQVHHIYPLTCTESLSLSFHEGSNSQSSQRRKKTKKMEESERAETETEAHERFSAFLQKRRKVTTLSVVAMLMQSFILGSSVIVGALALDAFMPAFGNLNFPGIFAPALSQFVAPMLTGEVITPLFRRRKDLRGPVSLGLVMFTPVGFALAGVAVATKSVPALYIAFVLVIGVSYSAFDGLTRMDILVVCVVVRVSSPSSHAGSRDDVTRELLILF